MRQITIPFTSQVVTDSIAYNVRVRGNQRADGIWEGCIEFESGAERLGTGVETTQPNAEALEYWASGLEQIYLDGALKRARLRRASRSKATERAERRV